MEDVTSDWFNLGDQTYKNVELFKMSAEFKSLNISYNHIAIAEFGGPIAILKRQDQIVLSSNDPTKGLLTIYANNGNIISQMSKIDMTQMMQPKEKIVGFHFNSEELLLIVFDSGTYFLVEPRNCQAYKFSLGGKLEELRIMEARPFNKGMVVRTMQHTFYWLNDVHNPITTKFATHPLQGQTEQWVIVPSQKSQSERLELHLPHPKAGIITIIEDEAVHVFFGLDETKLQQQQSQSQQMQQQQNASHAIIGIKFLQYSPSYALLAALAVDPATQSMCLYRIQSNFCSTLSFIAPPVRSKIDMAKQPYRLLWVAEHCVVLCYKKVLEMILDNKKDTDMPYRHPLIVNPKGYFFVQEVDGLKLVSNKSVTLLRRLPESYISIFRLLSFEPGAMLYEAFDSFQKNNPLPDEDIRNRKRDLAQGAKDCIEAGTFENNIEIRTTLLKAASYAKNFVPPSMIDHNMLSKVCKNLRVITSLQNELYARTITYTQLESLEDASLVAIVLRYRKHQLCFELCKFLDLFEFRTSVYVDWACCKVEASTCTTDEAEKEFCQKINEKLKQEKGISYTTIAKRAYDLGKQSLAGKLLDFEPSLAKKVPIFLWMGAFEKALEDALTSKDSNLINMVILKMIKANCQEEFVSSLMSTSAVSQAHLINYYKRFDDKDRLNNYLKSLQMVEESGREAIHQAYNTKKIEERLKFLNYALAFYQCSNKDTYYKSVLQDQISYYEEIVKMLQNKQQEVHLVDQSINHIFRTFLENDDHATANQWKKKFGIPDKRFYIMKIRVLIQKRDFASLDKLVEQVNKKTQFVSYELISRLLLKANSPDLAEVYIMKITDIIQQIDILKSIKSWAKATQQCIKFKLEDQLKDILARCNDANIEFTINNYFKGISPAK